MSDTVENLLKSLNETDFSKKYKATLVSRPRGEDYVAYTRAKEELRDCLEDKFTSDEKTHLKGVLFELITCL